MQFKDIVGQRDVINHLTEIIDSGRISHAQLVLGSAASGPMALALAYLQYLGCEHRQHFDLGDLRADSCGQCPHCKKMAQLVHPDLHFFFPHDYTTPSGSTVSGAEVYQEQFREYVRQCGAMVTLDGWHTAIDAEKKMSMIKETDASLLVRTVGLKSYEGGWKMVVVWLPEKMNASAANELLKTLEEPTPGTLMMLVCEDDSRMLSTVRSRVQYVKLHQVEDRLDPEVEAQYAAMLVGWLRMLFKLKMKELAAQVDKMAALTREQQMAFLQYVQKVMRDCFLNGAAGLPVALGSGDEKFDAQFPKMITMNNIEMIEQALDDAVFAVSRNAYGKTTMMQLSFRMSKALKNR